MRHLRAIGPETPWLVDLDAGVQALRQFYRWVEATKETLERAPGLAAIERSLRYLQASKGKVEFPAVEDRDISRIVELRNVVEGMPLPQLPDGFEKLVYDALRSWWRMSSEIGE